MTQEQYRALKQIWSYDTWTAIALNDRVHPPIGRETTATRNDKSTSENPLYDNDENEDEYVGDEMSDEAEGSEDGDDEYNHTSSVPTDIIERAVETTTQPRDRRRLYGNGSQLYACVSSETPYRPMLQNIYRISFGVTIILAYGRHPISADLVRRPKNGPASYAIA
jgi:hypothetical protein